MNVRTYLRRFGKSAMTAVIIGTISIVGLIGVRSMFTLRKIEVVGDGIAIEIDRSKFPDNLLFFPAAKMKTKLLSENRLLEDITFEKRFPDTLIIRPVLRKPIAVLELSDRMVFLAKTGGVVGIAGSADGLPTIAIDSTVYGVGSIVSDKRILAALAFIEAAAPVVPIERITSIDALSLRVKLSETDILITQNSDMAIVAATLQTMITGFRIKGTLPHTIDLRFRKPVVTF